MMKRLLVALVALFLAAPASAQWSSALNPAPLQLPLPSTTTQYAANTLLCSSATVATCNATIAATFFTVSPTSAGAYVPRLRISINDATSTAWGASTIQVDLWSAPPTFQTAGDRGVFATDFLTGTANHLGAYTCVMSAELADGVYGECYPVVGPASVAMFTKIYPTFMTPSGSAGVTGASKTVSLIIEGLN